MFNHDFDWHCHYCHCELLPLYYSDHPTTTRTTAATTTDHDSDSSYLLLLHFTTTLPRLRHPLLPTHVVGVAVVAVLWSW